VSRLSAIDASFLHLESASAHMNVGWSALGTLPPGVERPTVEDLRARVSSRLPYVPRCRQRVQFHPLGLGEPRWVDDEAFDVDEHVVALGEPLSLERFGELRDELLSTPLDRSRSLWQIAFAPRLEDGRVGVVGRVHHAMADGGAALLIAALGLDGDDEDTPPAVQPWRPEPARGFVVRAVDPLLEGAEITARAVGDVARAALRPRASARAVLRDARRVVGALTEDLLPRAPESQLNVKPGPRRTLLSHREPLENLRGAGAGTLNDVALAVVTGALRALALECGRPAQPLKALVPVDVRRPHEVGALGNHVSLAAVWLPLNMSSPAARLHHVRTATDRFKRANRPAGTTTVLAGLGLLPSGLRGVMLRAASPGAFNLSVSIIPGSRRPLYMLGARLDEIYPVVPIVENQALSIGMLRYHRHLHFGLYANPDALPQVTRLPALLAQETQALTGRRPAAQRRPA
jgi:diacylglycerol O-acyltransferase